MRFFKNDFGLIFIGAIILLLVSLYNGYPLVYSDTGTYLYSGFDKFIPWDRPIEYGLFIVLFSLKISLWLVVITQNILTSFAVFELSKFLIKKEILAKSFLLIISFLTFFTGIAWYSNQIMPDLFTPILIISLFLVLYNQHISKIKFIALICLLLFSSLVHFSHVLIAFTLFFLISIIEFVKNRNVFILSIGFKRLSIVFLFLCLTLFLMPLINYSIEKKALFSKGSHVFIMAHLCDVGILEQFLKEKCTEKEYSDCKLCKYKDSLPSNLDGFLWENNSILLKTGGFDNSKVEYNKIIFGTIKSPKYLLINVSKSFLNGVSQLANNEIGSGLIPFDKSTPCDQIKWRYPNELNNYLNSRQNRRNGIDLNFKYLNAVNLLVLILSFFLLIIIFTSKICKILEIKTVQFLMFSVISIIVNSFVTAGLNTVCERFQARVVWLLPFALLIVLIVNFSVFKNKILLFLGK